MLTVAGNRGPIVVVQECLMVLFLFYYLRNEVQHIVIKEKEEVYQYSLSESECMLSRTDLT